MAHPDQQIKPYRDNVWFLKRAGLSLLAFYLILALAAVLAALGAPHTAIDVCTVCALLAAFGPFPWLLVEDKRREERRRAAIRAQRGEAPIERDAPVAKRSARQRLNLHATLLLLLVLSFGLPLLLIGALTNAVALRNIGLVLTVVDVVVLAILLPGASIARHRSSRQRQSGTAEPS